MEQDSKHLVKIIYPLYTPKLTAYERMSLEHNIQMLAAYPQVLLIPQDTCADDYHTTLPALRQCETMYVPSENLGANGIEGYNRMMLSEDFYKRFDDCEYILICQADTWIFNDCLEEWCQRGFDYIGAPWWRRGIWSWPIIRLFVAGNRRLYGKVGNGGLSLRRIPAFIEVCQKQRKRINLYLKHKRHIFNEDVFWAIEPKNFRYPSMREAVRFSFDSHPDKCLAMNKRLPFGCHGWFKKDRLPFWNAYILPQRHD